MTTSTENKAKIEEARRHESDSGSPEVQIGTLTGRIQGLTEHLKAHKHDYSTQRGLQMLVGRRNRLLRYLARTNASKYQEVLQRHGLRK